MPNHSGTHDVMVKNIDPDCNNSDLAELFGTVGKLEKCRILPKKPDFDTTVGFVGYPSKSEAEQAIKKFHGYNFMGHRLGVVVALGKPSDDSKRQQTKTSPASSLSPENSVSSNFRVSRLSAPMGMGRGRCLTENRSITSFNFDGDSGASASSRPASAFHNPAESTVFKTPPRTSSSSYRAARSDENDFEDPPNRNIQSQFSKKSRVTDPTLASRLPQEREFQGMHKSESRRSDVVNNGGIGLSPAFGARFPAPKPSPAPQIRPPVKTFSKGDEVRFFVDLSTIDVNNLNGDINCLSESPGAFLQTLHDHYEKMGRDRAFFPAKPPQKSTFVAAPFMKYYFRAEVLKVQQNNIEIRFIDYGNKAEIDITDELVFPLEDRFIVEKPALHVKCRLGGSRRCQSIFEGKVQDCVEEKATDIVLDGKVLDFDADLQLVVLNIDSDEPETSMNGMSGTSGAVSSSKPISQSGKLESVDVNTIFNFDFFLHKETPCDVREVIEGTPVCVVCPSFYANDLVAFNAIVGQNECFAASSANIGQNEMVCAPYEGDKYRALVKTINHDKAKVYFLDYGNTEIVPTSELRRFGRGCPKEIFTKAAFALPCKIEGIKPKNGEKKFSKEVYCHLIELLKTEVFITGIDVVYDEDFDGKVLLVAMSSPDHTSFSDYLVHEGLMDRNEPLKHKNQKSASQRSVAEKSMTVGKSNMRLSNPPDEIRQSKHVFLNDIGVNENIHNSKEWFELACLNVESPSDFALIHPSDIDKMNNLVEKLGSSSTIDLVPIPTSDLVVGKLVLALSVDYQQYYRATVRRIAKNFQKTEVMFIDYGNREVLSPANLYELKQEFLSFPPLVMHCSLKNFPHDQCDDETRKEKTAKMMSEMTDESGQSLKLLKVRISDVQSKEDRSWPPVAEVDIHISHEGFGSTSLLQRLGIQGEGSTSCDSPLKNEKRESAVITNGQRSEEPREASVSQESRLKSKQDRTTIPVTLVDADKNSPDYHERLEARIQSLEAKLTEAMCRISQLEQLFYAFMNPGGSD